MDENNFGNFELSQDKIDQVTKIIVGKKLISSKYNIARTFEDGYTVIFNTLYDGVVVLDSKETELYNHVDDRCSFNESDIILFLLGILILNSEDEESIINIQRDELLFNRKGTPIITILPTQACNARCEYCFAEHNEKITISLQTIDDIIAYFVNNFHSGNKVIIRWFGGEPLLAKDAISKITNGIDKAFRGALQFDSIMFTNGSLLTDKIIEIAKKEWHLKKIQLTIDGYEHEHNRRKNYNDADVNYYKKTINDISQLLECGIGVDCRVNLDKDNIQQIDQILTDLNPYKDNPLFRARLTILRPSDCGYNIFNFIRPDDLEWAYGIIYRKLFSYGFLNDIKLILPQRRKESCISKSLNKVIIGADGKLYKCLQQVLSEEHSVGTLNSGIMPGDFVDKYCKKNIHSECNICVFLPLCVGGCDVYWDLQREEEVTPCIREKYFFDMLLEFVHNWDRNGTLNNG